MSALIDELLHDIPVEYRDRYAALLGEAPADTAALRGEVGAYLDTVRKVGPMLPFLDVDLAERLAASVLALLDHLDASGETDRLRAPVQAAARYFVSEEDDEEITGVLGFDDDVQVVNAVARAAGRPDLVIPLPPRGDA